MKRKKVYLLFFVFLFLIISIFLIFKLFLQTQLVGIGVPLRIEVTQDGKQYTYVFYSTNDYYIKEGCRPADCSNINACEVRSEVIGYEGDCPISKCQGYGWRDCENYASRQRCQYGHNCNSNDDYCSSHCDYWGWYDIGGTNGGIDYKHQDGCAWYVEIYDENNILIQRYSKIEEVEGWQEDRPYTTTQITTDKLIYPTKYINWGSECAMINGTITEDKYKIDFCIGTGTGDMNSPHCNKPITKYCILTCNSTQELDEINCICKDIELEYECYTDTDCESGYECINNMCIEKHNNNNWKRDLIGILSLVPLISLVSLSLYLRRKK